MPCGTPASSNIHLLAILLCFEMVSWRLDDANRVDNQYCALWTLRDCKCQPLYLNEISWRLCMVARGSPSRTNISGDPVPSFDRGPITSVTSVSLMREPYSSACNLVISFVPASCPPVLVQISGISKLASPAQPNFRIRCPPCFLLVGRQHLLSPLSHSFASRSFRLHSHSLSGFQSLFCESISPHIHST